MSVHHTPALTPEQLLIIADEFCEVFHTRIRSYAALVALAALPHASLAGIRIFDTEDTTLNAVSDAIRRLEPLDANNDLFAKVVVEITHRHNELC